MAEPLPEGRRRRLLILTYYWPPSGGSGVQRWLKFAKYLPEYGWECVVVTPADADFPLRDESLLAEVPAGTEVIHRPIWEPYAAYRRLKGAVPGEPLTVGSGGGGSGGGGSGGGGLLQRFATWVRANFFVPDPRVYWVQPTAAYLLRDYLPTHPVDAVVTTGPPHSVHLIGLALKRALPVLPWVMDVRDPWSRFDVHLAFGPGRRARAPNERLERECLTAADRVLGTSPSMPEVLEPFERDKYRCVTNGYDAEDFASLPDGAARVADPGAPERFHVYHTGLLSASRNPAAVWEALARLCAADERFAERLHVYLIGQVAEQVSADLGRHPSLAGKWSVEPWLEHGALVRRYADAEVLLLCPNQSDNAPSQINGKLFEYLAARRPILHVGPFDADNTRILDEAYAGLTVLPGDVDGALGAIRTLYTGRFGASEHAFQDRVIEGFERRRTARALAAVLDELTTVQERATQR